MKVKEEGKGVNKCQRDGSRNSRLWTRFDEGESYKGSGNLLEKRKSEARDSNVGGTSNWAVM